MEVLKAVFVKSPATYLSQRCTIVDKDWNKVAEIYPPGMSKDEESKAEWYLEKQEETLNYIADRAQELCEHLVDNDKTKHTDQCVRHIVVKVDEIQEQMSTSVTPGDFHIGPRGSKPVNLWVEPGPIPPCDHEWVESPATGDKTCGRCGKLNSFLDMKRASDIKPPIQVAMETPLESMTDKQKMIVQRSWTCPKCKEKHNNCDCDNGL